MKKISKVVYMLSDLSEKHLQHFFSLFFLTKKTRRDYFKKKNNHNATIPKFFLAEKIIFAFVFHQTHFFATRMTFLFSASQKALKLKKANESKKFLFRKNPTFPKALLLEDRTNELHVSPKQNKVNKAKKSSATTTEVDLKAFELFCALTNEQRELYQLQKHENEVLGTFDRQ
ncbi:hypothetical protein RFI_02350 [Reticulomyxa filosa]|uniref:Uncharacterized protein n=1 Tax=Reticulomyxa filosa TaxID=46433 RepID=X6P867_RETFI|nr:hypothetical protein RFI_02350 [Reticulomyxa filosa]|eukprot:ETO34740.1 hypothetical protein RFI_02350 [Reticulomyxa filosa]